MPWTRTRTTVGTLTAARDHGATPRIRTAAGSCAMYPGVVRFIIIRLEYTTLLHNISSRIQHVDLCIQYNQMIWQKFMKSNFICLTSINFKIINFKLPIILFYDNDIVERIHRDCLLTGRGLEYSGNKSVAASGKTCMNWPQGMYTSPYPERWNAGNKSSLFWKWPPAQCYITCRL